MKNNFLNIKKDIKGKANIVVVSKNQTVENITKIYDLGQRDFGENKVQEFLTKKDKLPKDIKWHFIGHLQTNKVKKIITHVHCIHSIDSLKLIKEINKQALKNNIKTSCLVQIHIAEEINKFGFNYNEFLELVLSNKIKDFHNISFEGLMGMATNTNETKKIEKEFKLLKSYYENLKKHIIEFKFLSIGMSNDYKTAIQEGSNLLRLGSVIFK
tara:strand:+ start:416 stop:1054 length:639 start_codon:yes stop_codon:yes gene_type:complete